MYLGYCERSIARWLYEVECVESVCNVGVIRCVDRERGELRELAVIEFMALAYVPSATQAYCGNSWQCSPKKSGRCRSRISGQLRRFPV